MRQFYINRFNIWIIRWINCLWQCQSNMNIQELSVSFTSVHINLNGNCSQSPQLNGLRLLTFQRVHTVSFFVIIDIPILWNLMCRLLFKYTIAKNCITNGCRKLFTERSYRTFDYLFMMMKWKCLPSMSSSYSTLTLLIFFLIFSMSLSLFHFFDIITTTSCVSTLRHLIKMYVEIIVIDAFKLLSKNHFHAVFIEQLSNWTFMDRIWNILIVASRSFKLLLQCIGSSASNNFTKKFGRFSSQSVFSSNNQYTQEIVGCLLVA